MRPDPSLCRPWLTRPTRSCSTRASSWPSSRTPQSGKRRKSFSSESSNIRRLWSHRLRAQSAQLRKTSPWSSEVRHFRTKLAASTSDQTDVAERGQSYAGSDNWNSMSAIIAHCGLMTHLDNITVMRGFRFGIFLTQTIQDTYGYLKLVTFWTRLWTGLTILSPRLGTQTNDESHNATFTGSWYCSLLAAFY